MSREYINSAELKAAFEEDGHLSAYVEDMIDSVDDCMDVVRCKDCKYYCPAPVSDGWNSCERDALIRHEDFFCAAGERKDEA